MWTRFVPAPFLLVAVLAGGCSRDGDVVPDAGPPSALGGTTPLRVLQNPDDPNRLQIDPPPTCEKAFSTPITIDGVSVNWVDRYDETGNGDVGTVWIQDFKSTAPWSGSSIFSASFVPASLYVAAGDVIDLRGLYQINLCVGRANFTTSGGTGRLSQIATPTSTFRFEGPQSEPVEVPISDFASFETGKKWIGMLVRFSNVNMDDDSTVDAAGRVSIPINGSVAIQLSNEFQSLGSVKRGARYASLTGVVTWFFSFKLASRTPEDLVVAAP